MKALADREGNSFRECERIRKRSEYLSIYKQGARTYSRNFTVVFQKNQLGYRRLGITVSKKVGGAVRRNRIKRMIREFFRLNKRQIAESQDTIVIGKKGIPRLSYQDVCRELEGLVSNRANK